MILKKLRVRHQRTDKHKFQVQIQVLQCTMKRTLSAHQRNVCFDHRNSVTTLVSWTKLEREIGLGVIDIILPITVLNVNMIRVDIRYGCAFFVERSQNLFGVGWKMGFSFRIGLFTLYFMLLLLDALLELVSGGRRDRGSGNNGDDEKK